MFRDPHKKPLQATAQSPERSFLQTFDFSQGLVEWGAPHGKMGRLMPAWLLGQLNVECLWVMDRCDIGVYPSAWRDLGVNLGKLHFLYEDKPLKSFKSLIHDHPFQLLVLDGKEFLTAGDLNFITQVTRQSQKPCFLVRPFYLTHRNGNPFAKLRFNGFYHFQRQSLQVKTLKGRYQGKVFPIPLNSERRFL